jgi:hypothetical protein
MWPTWLSFDDEFRKLGHGSQSLFQFLWMHPDLNSGGYITLAPRAWARRACDLDVEAVHGQLDELLATGWVAVDDDTQEVFVRPFLRLDASKKPHIYVSAMRTVQTCRSPVLRAAGWQEVLAVHPPPLTRDPKKDSAVYDKLEAERDAAFDELRSVMEGTVREPFSNRSGTLREPPIESEPGSESEWAGSRRGMTARSEKAADAAGAGECTRCRQAQRLGSEATPGENPMWCGGCNFEDAQRTHR